MSVRILTHATGASWDELLMMLPLPVVLAVLLAAGARKQRQRQQVEDAKTQEGNVGEDSGTPHAAE